MFGPSVRLHGDQDLGTHRVGERVDVALVLENEGRSIECLERLTAGDLLWGTVTQDDQPFTAYFRPPGIPPSAPRPRTQLGAGERRELLVEHVFFHWTNQAPGAYEISIRLPVGRGWTTEHTVRVTLTA